MEQTCLLTKAIGIIAIISCTNIWTLCNVFRKQDPRLTLNPDSVFNEKLTSTDLPSSLMKRLSENIENLQKSNNMKSGGLSYTESSETLTKEKRHTRYVKGKNKTIYDILSFPTNSRRVYIKSKLGPVLKMTQGGELGGTNDFKDPEAVFILETMTKGVVRIKGEKANKYICITDKGKLVSKNNPKKRCLLRQYLEENNLLLFWSHKYSHKNDGESGWFLALKRNKKMRKPVNTTLGDQETMFHVLSVDKT